MPDPQPKSEEVFDVERIRQLIELMKEHDLAEIDLRKSQQRIRLCRGNQNQPTVFASPAHYAPPAIPQSPAVAAASGTAAAAPPAASDDLDGPHITVIKSPMVGTFYSKPNPNAKNFVEVGSTVTPDSVVCIIEAMKVFNEIPAEIRGKIVAVLVENESAVEFGKPLFKVDTRG